MQKSQIEHTLRSMETILIETARRYSKLLYRTLKTREQFHSDTPIQCAFNHKVWFNTDKKPTYHLDEQEFLNLCLTNDCICFQDVINLTASQTISKPDSVRDYTQFKKSCMVIRYQNETTQEILLNDSESQLAKKMCSVAMIWQKFSPLKKNAPIIFNFFKEKTQELLENDILNQNEKWMNWVCAVSRMCQVLRENYADSNSEVKCAIRTLCGVLQAIQVDVCCPDFQLNQNTILNWIKKIEESILCSLIVFFQEQNANPPSQAIRDFQKQLQKEEGVLSQQRDSCFIKWIGQLKRAVLYLLTCGGRLARSNVHPMQSFGTHASILLNNLSEQLIPLPPKNRLQLY